MEQSVSVQGTTERSLNKKTKRSWRWLWILLAVLVIVGGFLWWRSRSGGPPVMNSTRTEVRQGSISLLISGSGSVAAARTIDVPFQQSGTVTSVDVRVGESVTKGQLLAAIDAGDLELAVQQAQASLKVAEANYKAALNGSATEQDIAVAQASLASAQAQLNQTRNGTATQADIESARASLKSAQAQLDALKNPTEASILSAETNLAQAKTNLESQRNSLSQAKTNAYNSMQQAVNSLTQAQTQYSTAKQQWQYVQDENADPSNPTVVRDGKTEKNKLNDAQRQQYYNAFVQAETAMRNAEISLQQAELAYNNARDNEATQIPLLEQQVANAQAQLDALRNPSPSSLAQAEASVAQAQANLNKLLQGGTAAEIKQAEASVAQAASNLESLSSPSSEAELASAEASLLQAQVNLATAERNLKQAGLVAPFDGVVAAVSVQEGANVNSGTVAFTIVDVSKMHVAVSLTESDAAKVEVGQVVTVTFDALPDVSIEGKVSSISPAASTEQNVVTYPVEIEFEAEDVAVKVGMSASADIVVEQVEDALIVPSRAVTSRGGRTVVMLMQNGQPTPVEVKTGIVSNGQTQIVSSAEGGPQLKAGDTVMMTLQAGTVNQNSNRGGFGGPGGGGFGGGMPGGGMPPSP
jgi:HlyD family secretion protein